MKEFISILELEEKDDILLKEKEEKEINEKLEKIKDDLFNKLSENNNLSYIEINHFLLNEINQLLTVEIYKQVTEKDHVLVNLIKPDYKEVIEVFSKLNIKIIEDKRFVELFNNHTFKKEKYLTMYEGSIEENKLELIHKI